jgi:hypothetical protein
VVAERVERFFRSSVRRCWQFLVGIVARKMGTPQMRPICLCKAVGFFLVTRKLKIAQSV